MRSGARIINGTHRSHRGGSVLIVVMWACLGLVAMTLVFAQSMAMNYRGAGNDLAGRQAEAAVGGGAHYAEYIVSTLDVPGLFPDPTTYEVEAVPVGDANFWFLGGGGSATSQNLPGALNAQPYGLVDEASKLNLNTASADMLAQLPGMTPDFAASIVAYRTAPGSDPTSASGSVSGLGGANTYTVKNAAFETPEEVGMVSGADKTFLYGEDANLNGILDPNEDDSDRTPPADNADGKLDGGLLSYVTTFTREPNKRADGTTPRINVSNVRAARGALATLFAQTPTLASSLPSVLTHFPQGSPPVGSVLEFFVRSGLTADQFAPISDALTVKGGDYLTGLVNVNTAPVEVLTCIPGIGQDLATTLVAARTSRATPTDTSIAWVAATLGQGSSIVAGKYLTGASFQACADVAAVGLNGRGYRRTRFVIDTSTGTPRIIYRRDLSGLGWALGSEARDTLARLKATTPLR